MRRERKVGTLQQLTRNAAVSGTVASLMSTLALAQLGRRDAGRATAPINAVSHWYWDTEALRHGQPSLKYTLPGYLTHHAASIFWAAAYEQGFGRAARRSPAAALAAGAVVAALAAFVDFTLTPRRLTPGFEHRLTRRSLVLVYGAFALGLALNDIGRLRR
jgi:hypothetical protein